MEEISADRLNPESPTRQVSSTMTDLTYSCALSNGEIERYSRQLVLPEFGASGQTAVCGKSFLVVGAGGLGCSAAIHLAGSGAGRITIVDHDRIEKSNLHRQIMYTSGDVGKFKSEILAERCNNLNPDLRSAIAAITASLTTENAMDLVEKHDIILDCTDNVHTRYLLNDACVLIGKAVVSASALKFEGQLTVYNYKDSPCRRCLFPDASIMQTESCGDNGVMGPVPGILGSLQAMEAIKLASGLPVSFGGVTLHYSSLSGSFYRIKLRGKNPNCPVCGSSPVITQLDDKFLGPTSCELVPLDKKLPASDRISVTDLKESLECVDGGLVVDVRPTVELEICGVRNVLNIPFDHLLDQQRLDGIRSRVEERLKQTDQKIRSVSVLCRRGNDSQLAVHILRSILPDMEVDIKDVVGGLYEWKDKIDPDFPVY